MLLATSSVTVLCTAHSDSDSEKDIVLICTLVQAEHSARLKLQLQPVHH